MTARHTPGPWSIGDENNACCDVLLGTEHNLTCSMDRRDNNTCAEVISRAEMLANAHLIAAAPDMLEALKDSREALRRAGTAGELMVVNAAIAKATGEPSP